jgi:glycosyltransferase involved in cell wall biosynthesis
MTRPAGPTTSVSPAEAPPGLRVLVDARALHASGIGRYLREVLLRLLVDERFRSVILLGVPQELQAFVANWTDSERIEYVDFRHPMYSPAAQLGWYRLERTNPDILKAQVYFFPHYDAPARLPARSVVTVHDLIHFKVPSAFPLTKRLPARLLLRQVVRKAERILVDSESTRRDLVEMLPYAKAKSTVVYPGVSDFFVRQRGTHEEISLQDLPAEYLLCVGNRKPHKNLAAAVEVLAELSAERPNLHLVIVGQVFDGWEEVERLARQRGVRERIRDFTYVGDAELRELYERCEALIFPSFYEGFGLPVLEAMACATPVICSNRSSIPEVAGDAAILLDPSDHVGMANAVRRLRAEPSFRERLVTAGSAQAGRFSWEKTARATLDQLMEVGRGGSPLTAENATQTFSRGDRTSAAAKAKVGSR